MKMKHSAGKKINNSSDKEGSDVFKKALIHALKEYRDLADSDADTMLACQENAQYYGTAADHILQQVKVIDERNMDSAVASLESLGYADNYGAEMRLLNYIDFSSHCLEDSVEMLKKSIDCSRSEYQKSRHSSEFIDEALETNYSNLKATYMALLRDVGRRSALNDKQWIRFEEECRQWQVSQMTALMEKYHGPNSGYGKIYKSTRKHVNKRLSDFVNVYLNHVQTTLKESSYDYQLSHRNEVKAAIQEKNKVQLELEQWLSNTICELEDIYMEQVEKYKSLLCDIRHHIYSLELHQSKLNQLSRLYSIVPPANLSAHISERKSYAAVLDGTDLTSMNESKSQLQRNVRHPLSSIYQPGDISGSIAIGGQDRSPPWTMSLGSRVYELARRVGITSDELALCLQDLLYDLPESEPLLEKLNLVCSVYNINWKSLL